MAKKVIGQIKLQIPAGKATPAPPVGPALGQHGVAIMDFCKAFNARTSEKDHVVDKWPLRLNRCRRRAMRSPCVRRRARAGLARRPPRSQPLDVTDHALALVGLAVTDSPMP